MLAAQSATSALPRTLAALATIAASVASAATAAAGFGAADLVYSRVQLAGENYHPSLVRVQGGYWLIEGVALSLQLATGVSEDSRLGLNAEVERMASWWLRFESPERDGFRLYLAGGYSEARLSLRTRGSGLPGRERFAGPAFGLGLAQRLGSSPWSLNADLSRHYDEDDVDLRTLSLGLEVEF